VSRGGEYSSNAQQSNEIVAEQGNYATSEAECAGATLAEQCKNLQGGTASSGTKLAQRVHHQFQPHHIAICVCTYRRPKLLKRCLDSLAAQIISPDIALEIVVIDNEPELTRRSSESGTCAPLVGSLRGIRPDRIDLNDAC
jgi:hypothetical protein